MQVLASMQKSGVYARDSTVLLFYVGVEYGNSLQHTNHSVHVKCNNHHNTLAYYVCVRAILHII